MLGRILRCGSRLGSAIPSLHVPEETPWLCLQAPHRKARYDGGVIYIYRVGSTIGPHLGFRVNNWATVGSITGPHRFSLIKVVFLEDVCEPSFQRGVQMFRRFLVFWSKNRIIKKGMVAIPFFKVFVFSWCLLVDVSTRLLKECDKKTTKRFFFSTPFLRERKRVEKKTEVTGQKTPPFLHCFFWGP